MRSWRRPGCCGRPSIWAIRCWRRGRRRRRPGSPSTSRGSWRGGSSVPVELVCFDAARKSFEAMTTGQADICFLAVDPAREAEVAFSTPYVVIEGVLAVPLGSAVTTADDVDSPGTRIGVKRGSAYDLFLSRTLRHADGRARWGGRRRVPCTRAWRSRRASGSRLTAYVAAHPDVRLVGGPVHGDPAGRRHHHDPPAGDRRLSSGTWSRSSRPTGSSPTRWSVPARPDASVAPPAAL